jgi:hypothetical protein
MSILAGVFSRDAAAPIPADARSSLEKLISRHPGDRAEVYQHPRCLLLQVNVGAFDGPEREQTPRCVAIVAGQPLADHRASLTEAVVEGRDREWLVSTRGSFAAACFEPSVPRLVLAVDKMGVRPMYFWADERFVYFSTALRILEGFHLAPKRPDIRGVTEAAAFGYSLSDRTVYAGIVRLHAGEVVEFAASRLVRRRYWRWDSVRESRLPIDELAHQAYEAFCEAVAVRRPQESAALAFLSGGLDSRCVVAALLGLGMEVHTVTLGVEPSQDTLFASAFADAAGTRHHEVRRSASDLLEWLPSLAEALGFGRDEAPPAANSRVIWSGDGGSVGLGCVYITPQIEAKLKNADEEGAVSAYVGSPIPSGMLAPSWRKPVLRIPFEGVLHELSCIDHADPLQKFYLHLMLNDQRRHLTAFYESIDLHRMEYQLPFYDGRFLQVVASAPRAECLYHRFYSRWLRCFPAVVSSVPWQTYPGHDPCPLPVPEGLLYQWSSAAEVKVFRSCETKLIREIESMLLSGRFPKVLSRPSLAVGLLLHLLKVRKYSYMFRAASAYRLPWRLSSGPGELSGLSGSRADVPSRL